MTQIFHENPPLSLYIHLPWCIKKCPYCDFNSHEILTSAFREELYVNALIDDLKHTLELKMMTMAHIIGKGKAELEDIGKEDTPMPKIFGDYIDELERKGEANGY